MKEKRHETPDEIFRAEVENLDPQALLVSSVEFHTPEGIRYSVRFKLGGTEIYHWPEDAKRIATAIIECAEHGRKK